MRKILPIILFFIVFAGASFNAKATEKLTYQQMVALQADDTQCANGSRALKNEYVGYITGTICVTAEEYSAYHTVSASSRRTADKDKIKQLQSLRISKADLENYYNGEKTRGVAPYINIFFWQKGLYKIGDSFEYEFDFSGMNLSNSIFRYISFEKIKGSSGNFSNSDWTGAGIFDSDLVNINFSGSNMKFARLWRINAVNSNFDNTNLQNATLYGDFTGSTFRNANLQNIEINADSIFKNADFTGSDTSKIEFTTQDLSGAKGIPQEIMDKISQQRDIATQEKNAERKRLFKENLKLFIAYLVLTVIPYYFVIGLRKTKSLILIISIHSVVVFIVTAFLITAIWGLKLHSFPDPLHTALTAISIGTFFATLIASALFSLFVYSRIVRGEADKNSQNRKSAYIYGFLLSILIWHVIFMLIVFFTMLGAAMSI